MHEDPTVDEFSAAMTTSENTRLASAINRKSAMVAAIWIATTGAVSFLFLPLIIGSIANSLGFASTQLGYIAAADMLGMGLMSATSIFWVRKVNWRTCALLGIGAMVIANLLSCVALSVWSMALCRLLNGLGGGAMIAIGVACQSDHKKADKVFSYFIALEMLVMSIGFIVLPQLENQWPLQGLLISIAAVVLLATPVLRWLPQRGLIREKRKPVLTGSRGHALLDVMSLTGALLFFMSQGGLWAFLARMGEASGMSGGEVGSVLAASSYTGIVGALSAAFLTRRCGALGSFMIVLLGELVSMAMLFGHVDYWQFMAAVLLFQFCWCLAWPLLMSAFNALDCTGRLVLLLFAVAKIGYTLGPAIIGYLIDGNTYTSVIIFSMLVCSAGIGTILILLVSRKRNTALVAA